LQDERVNQVTVVSTKWDGSFHRKTIGLELGADRHGTWVWMPAGTVVSSGAGPFEISPCLRLLQVGLPWSAYFVPADPGRRRPKQLYVDITTPATRTGQLFSFVDLDLDVEQLDDGEVRVLDRPEFEEHAARFGYPAELVETAESTCRLVVEAVRSRQPPFDGAHRPWLELAAGLG
jgi:hypothetical protein